MKGSFISGYGRTRPGVASKMKRILMTFSFVFVFESIVTVGTLILLLHHVRPGRKMVRKS